MASDHMACVIMLTTCSISTCAHFEWEAEKIIDVIIGALKDDQYWSGDYSQGTGHTYP